MITIIEMEDVFMRKFLHNKIWRIRRRPAIKYVSNYPSSETEYKEYSLPNITKYVTHVFL